jgi:phenylpropionate dioxygenase-like ring-hydroxylating dioxygenase large terminal subunit
MIPIEFYKSKLIFEKEKKLYFGNNFFVGTDSNLDNDNDYKTVNYYFKPLTIRNSNGIKVFSNICLHRASLIDGNDYGNAPFACRYHGWSYAHDGSILRTPLDDALKNCKKKLSVIPSDKVKNFIFVNPEKGFANRFESIVSKVIPPDSKFFYRNLISHNCNWKLLVENVLEHYHLSFVHKDTFAHAGFTSTSKIDWAATELGSYNYLQSKNNQNSYYKHFDIQSNLFISDTNGRIIFISYFFPISISETLLIYELWETPDLLNKPDYIRRKIQEKSIFFTNRALQEDKAVLENTQFGVSNTDLDFVLSEIAEPRVLNFHINYMNKMVSK